MKARYLLFAFLFIGLASNVASASPVALVVKNCTPHAFSVVLDRQRVATHVNAFQFAGLTPGRHRVQIVADRAHRPSSRYAGSPYLYDSWIDFHPGETMTLDIQPNGVVYASSYIAPCAQPVLFQPAALCNKPYQHPYDAYVPAPVYLGMSPDDFFSLKQAVINRSFDSTKRELLASALKHNQITSAQLYELLSLLDFDSSKVEIAKIGYNAVVDKYNFFKVYDAFSFDSSIAELQRFIG